VTVCRASRVSLTVASEIPWSMARWLAAADSKTRRDLPATAGTGNEVDGEGGSDEALDDAAAATLGLALDDVGRRPTDGDTDVVADRLEQRPPGGDDAGRANEGAVGREGGVLGDHGHQVLDGPAGPLDVLGVGGVVGVHVGAGRDEP
jgi:hypothetical protein